MNPATSLISSMKTLQASIPALLVLMIQGANAELITAGFSGSVNLIIDYGGNLDPRVQLGSRISGAFTFESTTTGAAVTDGSTYVSGSSSGQVYLSMSTDVYSFHSFSVQIDVANNARPHANPFGPREDRFRAGWWGSVQSANSSLIAEHMVLEFSTTNTAALADSNLPRASSDLSGFDGGTKSFTVFGNYQGHNWQISARVDTLTMPASPPPLNIEYVPSWPVVILAWPISATGYFLEESSGLDNQGWTRVSQLPTIIVSEYKIAVEPTADRKFYRLRR
jgi:hypothetical protein